MRLEDSFARISVPVSHRLWARKSMAAWLIATVAAVVLLATLVRDARSSAFIDFTAYYTGASALRHGARLYADALAWKDAAYTNWSPGKIQPTAGLPYVYPPAFAAALVPLTFLPLRIASLLWFALIFGSLTATAFILASLFFSIDRRYQFALGLGLSAMLVVIQPVRMVLWDGQADCLILLLLALSLQAFSSRLTTRAGLWLGLAVSIKPTLGFLLAFYLWKRAYRALAVACGVAATLLALPLLILGIGALRDLISVSRYWSSPAFDTTPVNQSPYGFLLRLFTTNPYTHPIVASLAMENLLRYGGIALTLSILVIVIRRSWTSSKGRLGLEYGLAVAAMLLVAPLVEDIQYVYLAVPLAVVAGTLWNNRSRERAPVLLAAALAAIYVYLLNPKLYTMRVAFFAFNTAPVSAPKLFLMGAYLYALVALFALLLAALLWARQGAASGARATSGAA